MSSDRSRFFQAPVATHGRRGSLTAEEKDRILWLAETIGVDEAVRRLTLALPPGPSSELRGGSTETFPSLDEMLFLSLMAQRLRRDPAMRTEVEGTRSPSGRALRRASGGTLISQANEAYARLRSDLEAWAEMTRERDEWDATLADGLEGEPDDADVAAG